MAITRKRLMLHSRHLPTTFGAGLARVNTVGHPANFFAIQRAGGANFGANAAYLAMKLRAAELEIG
jgi:hypothetical protein